MMIGRPCDDFAGFLAGMRMREISALRLADGHRRLLYGAEDHRAPHKYRHVSGALPRPR